MSAAVRVFSSLFFYELRCEAVMEKRTAIILALISSALLQAFATARADIPQPQENPSAQLGSGLLLTNTPDRGPTTKNLPFTSVDAVSITSTKPELRRYQ
jgi:hypothetical protein